VWKGSPGSRYASASRRGGPLSYFTVSAFGISHQSVRGHKVSDEFTVPLCRIHHRAVHHGGDERAWWKATGIDPDKIAGTLWRKSRVRLSAVAQSYL
jgi:hypothetical protein